MINMPSNREKSAQLAKLNSSGSNPRDTRLVKFDIENRRYIGSKVRLIPNIFESIPDGFRHGHFFDIFGGTGVVAAKATQVFAKVTVNDHLYSNQVTYQAFFGSGRFAQKTLEKFAEEVRSIKLPKSNYFSKEFGGRYFSKHDAILIGAIRDRIEIRRSDLSRREYFVLLASLMYSTDRSARTVGHYEAFLRNVPSRNSFEFRLIQPIRSVNVSIFREDANQLARKIRADVTYVDPPYNSRQYSRFYHVLETLIKWEKPELSGVARKPPTENSSDYCKSSAPEAFADLIASLDTRLIVVSYNNTYESKSNSSKNKISHEFIRESLSSRGEVKVESIELPHFNAGKSSLPNHREFLFVCKT